MAVKELNNPGHFVGLSVRRMVDGVRYQKYYSFRDPKGIEVSNSLKEYLRDEAKGYDERLKIQQDIARQARKERAEPDRSTKEHHLTGVRGIQVKMNVTKKGNKVHMYPMFLVFVAEGQKSFFIDTLGKEEAWRLACKELARLKGIASYEHLIARMPSDAHIIKMKMVYLSKQTIK